MADVTDVAFRRLIARHGKPDVMWTEFVSADGLYATREKLKMKDSENPLMRDLLFDKSEHPIVAQLFSSNPEKMEYAGHLVKELGFDGIDINMGCPDKSIEKQGCGAGMIKNPERAKEIIRAAQKSGLPVSVKTRIGYNHDEIDTWIPELLKENLAVLTVHFRTRKEMSKVPARWELMKRVVALRDQYAPETLILGNGDVQSVEHAKELATTHGGDGAMLGRAIFGNPWLFSNPFYVPTIEEKLQAMVEHTKLFSELLPHKSFYIMKKHYKAYVSGFDGAHELRAKLMETNTPSEVETIVEEYLTR